MARAFERPATIALPDEVGAGLALEGLYVPVEEGGNGGAVIAAPHPLMGGSMESPVVTELAWACEQAGRSSLRFNWRGVGASAGAPSGEIEDADVDYASARRFLLDTVPGAWMACGYSFGALAALRAAEAAPPPERMILVAPPTRMLDPGALERFGGEVLIVAGQDDEWVDAGALSSVTAELDGTRLEVIPRCDHFFMTGLVELRAAVGDWLAAVG